MLALYPKQRIQRTKSDNGVLCIKHLPPTKLDDMYFKYVFWPLISPVLGYFNAKRVLSKKCPNRYFRDITDIEIDGINYKDHPDYCDAFISSATWRSSLTALTENQINQLNENHSDFVYESVQKHLY